MDRQLITSENSLKEKSSISSGKLSDKKLKFSELRYRRLFEAAQDGILILNADSGKIVDANPFLKKILDYSEKELLGKELWEIGVFKNIVDSKAAFRKLQTDGYIRYKDLPLQTKNGHSIDVEFISNVYIVDTQKVIQCNIRDISDRRRAEKLAESRAEELEQLNKSHEETKKAMLNVMEDLKEAKIMNEIEKVKDEAMLASIGEGLIAVNNDRKIITINKAAEHTLGWKMEELIDKKITVLHLENEEGHLMPLDERPADIALSTGKMTNTNYYYVKKDKTRIPIAITVTPIKLSGKTIGAVIIFRDITREKEIERAKNEFVSLASHQLRTPLGIVKWYLEVMKGEGYLDKAPKIAMEYLDEVYKSNERLLSLVRDLLSVSRIDQGKVRNTPKLISITNLIKDVIKNLNILAAKNHITLHLDLKKPNIPAMLIDPLRVQEIVENLIANAITYSKPHGKVAITVDARDNKMLIAVKDTGIGIARADKEKLFTKFFRSEKAVEQNAEGSGLGLYVVKSYVEGWGGTIAVVSEEGKGSTFTISLPTTKPKID